MPVELSGRRIFIASPGGLSDERALCRRVVSSFNERIAHERGVAFIAHGWEDVPGALGRPQETINRYVRESDFVIMMVGDKMGSPTTINPPFLTGIEEEFVETLTCCGSPELPMRDSLLLFKTVEGHRLVNPDSGLQSVLDFKDRIETSKEILYQRFEAQEQLTRQIERNLMEWSRPLGPKDPRSYPVLLAAIGADDRTGMEHPPSHAPDELVEWAEARASLGLTTQAEAAFAQAARHRRPADLERYARFTRRTGQLQRAYELNEQILGLDDVVVSSDPLMVATRARALANMGLVKRKQGDLQQSRELLEEAAQTARGGGPDGSDVLAYALDLLGLTLARLGNLSAAAASYEEALGLRRRTGNVNGEAKSLVNLARLARQSGERDTAVGYLTTAIDLLEEDGDEPALANALASYGETLAAESPADAEELLERSLGINERLKNIDGISVVSGDLARLNIARGDLDAARRYAERTMAVSSTSANREGTAIAFRLLGQIEHAAGNMAGALELLTKAVEAAASIDDPSREAAARLALARVLREEGGGTELSRTIELGLDAARRADDSHVAAELQQLSSD